MVENLIECYYYWAEVVENRRGREGSTGPGEKAIMGS